MKSPGFLRFIIVYKAFIGVLLVGLSAGIMLLPDKELEAVLTWFSRPIEAEADIAGIAGAEARVINGDLVQNIAVVVFLFGLLNIVESWGLHLKRRWAEWLTVGGTSALIPYEFYEVVTEASLLKVWILFINVIIVYYLARHKELFKGRREILNIFKVF